MAVPGGPTFLSVRVWGLGFELFRAWGLAFAVYG